MSKAKKIEIREWNNSNFIHRDDWIAPEAPLSIVLEWHDEDGKHRRDLAVTMRTPGHDHDLVRGLLYSEGIIAKAEDIQQIRYMDLSNHEIEETAKVLVNLAEGIIPDTEMLDRQFTAYAACGICGKQSLDQIESLCPFLLPRGYPSWSPEMISSLPDKLLNTQEHFENTGGMHAAALFDLNGEIIMIREDIGRHNAVDKVIGAAITKITPPMTKTGLLLSGRAGFELVQKALAAGITMVAAIGAASSLAITLAKDHDLSLIGFLRKDRMIIYTGWDRVTGSIRLSE